MDTRTGKRASLRTADPAAAQQVVEAKNQAERQPVLNLQIARAYLAGTDSGITTRTWHDALQALTDTKHGATLGTGRSSCTLTFNLFVSQ